eukprot:GHVH01004058.1.p1 GENE.GHVH01004058.1~~GHVH01004058.1.p1  ORF type:complete len:410 (-),score=45.83 GHVH01004058.1:286-1515(-)
MRLSQATHLRTSVPRREPRLMSYSHALEPVMIMDEDSKVDCLGSRRFVSSWMKRYRMRSRLRNRGDREIRKGCTTLHTSGLRHARSPSDPSHGVSYPMDDEASFHSCYSYDRESYNWWWYSTASEVFRSYLGSFAMRADGILRLGYRTTGGAPGGNFTPRMNMTFKTCLASEYLNVQFNSTESFWEFGFDTATSSAMPMVVDVAKLNADYPDCHNSIFTPPIQEVAKLGWSDTDEALFDFPSLVDPQSFEEVASEIVRLAQSMRGHWVSIMPRCGPIEFQFKFMGIPYMKRSILARIAIPLTIFLEDCENNQFNNLHTWIHTPIGLRHLNWSTVGKLSVDKDPDCGVWEGLVRPVSVYLPSMDRTVRALQRILRKPKDADHGVTIETRCVIPDHQEGRILYFQIDTFDS